PVRWELHGRTAGFSLGPHHAHGRVVIDPAIVYGTYLGGTGSDVAQWVAVDSSGDAYLAGYTTSPDFPLEKPESGTYGGNTDAFVTKLDPSGSPVYSTYLGGKAYDLGAAVAVDGSGSAYVTGR